MDRKNPPLVKSMVVFLSTSYKHKMTTIKKKEKELHSPKKVQELSKKWKKEKEKTQTQNTKHKTTTNLNHKLASSAKALCDIFSSRCHSSLCPEGHL